MKKIITIILIVVLVILLIFVLRFVLNQKCYSYGPQGVRSSVCGEDAPFYCKNRHYPPSCDYCQDYVGCGFIF